MSSRSCIRVLGIDPGSRVTGYGIVEMEANQTHRIASGVVNIPALPMPQRLKIIFDEIGAVVREFQPDRMAVEQVFVSRNFDSAIKLSHARAAAICAGVTASL
ncbi:MAG TPA: crossover junction endodeoxyribonuclease RuvC, partial [Chromatiales bacterium]|nr:crossover junction endodeoxyribonuclease RuvC [Chromatiales bacterium]